MNLQGRAEGKAPRAQSSPGSAFLSQFHTSVCRHLPANSASDLPAPYPVAFIHPVREMNPWCWAGHKEGNAVAAFPKPCCALSFLLPLSLLPSPHLPYFKLNLLASLASLSAVLFPFKKTQLVSALCSVHNLVGNFFSWKSSERELSIVLPLAVLKAEASLNLCYYSTGQVNRIKLLTFHLQKINPSELWGLVAAETKAWMLRLQNSLRVPEAFVNQLQRGWGTNWSQNRC